MKLFSRKQQHTQPIIPPELQPYYNMGSHQKSMWRNRQVLLPLAVIVAALLVIGIVVWQIIAHTTPNNSSSGRTPAASQSPQHNTTPKTTGAPATTPSTGKTNTSTVPNPGE
jgi:hypothetical protein